MKILAGMVTYNRCGVVRTAIEALLSQTTPPDDIIIIDNMSQDSTGSIVAGYASRNVYYYRTHANLGGAGGFALLMEIFAAGDLGHAFALR
ncbi:MAG TPA: glycosyltransferase [Acetobacteraceae bacterium]|nr:glycosyltransferase [Acetobacteraceae bacterium]